MRTIYNYPDLSEQYIGELNTSNEVKEVQRFLHTRGYDLGSYGVDGDLCPKTKKALYSYFKTEINSGGRVTPQVNPPVTPSTGSKLDRFIAAHGTKTFKNSNEINTFFTQLTGKDFCTWFKDEIGNKGFWGNITFEGRAKHGRSIPRNNFTTHQNNFNRVWDNIPLIFNGALGNHSINIFQFFALVSIIINETGGKFTPISERGSLRYMFGTNSGKKRSYNTATANEDAYTLFRNNTFLNAHRSLPNYTRVANTTNRAWSRDVYPSGFSTDPTNAGIISEADFYKFRGRGLIQTTFRSTYSRLINFIKNYSGANTTLLNYKRRWSALTDSVILTTSRNADWDTLFLNTNLEFPCYAIYNFQHRRNNFLSIPATKAKLIQESTARSGSGSIFYVGYRVGGNSRYGRLLKKRVLQMIDKLT
ncbi:hypothetical protein MBM09_00275 [Flaviramulus sp. BrNp1-15]|uniref:peptidoglycan-binding domain-containing protein n=1 Tax=Flaviramulus sp. BrNp1-15 TaxID=2916754 RepID=UPI001EE80D54|nr:hypothetical protein [Flaviramulus sp. BrNp1-15]ULC59431.1 hypothetical protein MBM09_00275 [Flaviramulus sp. BrNp1-15]